MMRPCPGSDEYPIFVTPPSSPLLYLTSAEVKLKYPNFFGRTTKTCELLDFGGIRLNFTTVWPPNIMKIKNVIAVRSYYLNLTELKQPTIYYLCIMFCTCNIKIVGSKACFSKYDITCNTVSNVVKSISNYNIHTFYKVFVLDLKYVCKCKWLWV